MAKYWSVWVGLRKMDEMINQERERKKKKLMNEMKKNRGQMRVYIVGLLQGGGGQKGISDRLLLST